MGDDDRGGDRSTLDLPDTLPVAARPDEVFDRFARLVRTTMRVPTALVTFVSSDLQVFPGAVGLPEPWQTTRCTPLSLSFCQYVVGRAQPLIVSDARESGLLAGHPAIDVLGAVAYASMPLRSAGGKVIGALCAIDRQRRDWSPGELSLLSDLAATCEGELRLREALLASRAAGAAAERARDAATTAELAAVGQRQEAEHARAHSELLLELSEVMAATRDVDDVASAVIGAARRGLGAVFAGVALADERDRTMRYLSLTPLTDDVVDAWATFSLDEASGPASAARLQRPYFHESAAAFVADFPHLADDLEAAGLGSVAHLPLLTAGTVIGTLAIGWPTARTISAAERSVLAALAGYTAQALQRCLLLEAERGVAATLQRSMLTELPSMGHLEVMARYVPAAAGHEVGGDWYDGFVTPDGALTVVIGDVTGHDVEAAATMGQLRASLRTLVVALDQPPAASLSVLDRALADLALPATATAVLARLEQDGELAATGTHRLRWSNAGHPPPLLLAPDGRVQVLESPPDLLLGFFPETERSDHTVDLPEGSTLILYTDGLVERRRSDLSAGTTRLVRAVEGLAGADLADMLDQLLAMLVGAGAEDDVALLAVRIHSRSTWTPPGAAGRRSRGRHSR